MNGTTLEQGRQEWKAAEDLARHLGVSGRRLVGSFTRQPDLRYNRGVKSSDLITVDPDILGGTPVFRGTRVPVKTLFDYLEDNFTLDEFLECFPSVTREMARGVLEQFESALVSDATK
jgi:uncharacterized protein (DUF433 family)